MFFAPTILALQRQYEDLELYSLCLSVGDADGLGDVRRTELEASLDVLGIQEGKIPSGNGRPDALDQLEPIYVPLGGSVLAYINDPACIRFSA